MAYSVRRPHPIVWSVGAGPVPFGKLLHDPLTPKRHFAARPPHRAQTSTYRRHLRNQERVNTFASIAYAVNGLARCMHSLVLPKFKSPSKEDTMTQTAVGERGSEQASDNTAIRPFHVNVPQTELTELRRRINATKFPDERRFQMQPKACSSPRCRRWRAIGPPSMTGARSKRN